MEILVNGPASRQRAFKLKPVAAGCVLLVSAMANTVQAQETAPAADEAAAPIQTVTISGIRRGIEAAISVKKDASSIVEAVSAEDLGKLPDTSIAESISRLPGVSAQYTNGRAKTISVRGMSPDFSTALLNGREQASTGDSRGVYFDQYPSELLSGVVVYKTPDGALVGQGLSGTIDLQTVRPLNFAKRTMAINHRKEKNGRGTPFPGSGNRTSLSYIDQFFDRKLGVALGFARLDGRTSSTRFDSWGGGTTTYNGQTVNVPYNGFNAETDKTTQQRDGAMAVLQYRPNREFSTVLDVFYSKFDSTTNKSILQMPLNDSWTSPDSPYERAGVLTDAVLSGSDVVSGTFNNVRAVVRNEPVIDNDKMTSIGWNNTWRASRDWKFVGDLNYSSAQRYERDQEVYAGTVGTSADPNVFSSVGFKAGSHAFTSTIDYADPSIIKITDGQGWGGGEATPQAGYSKGPDVSDKIRSARASATYQLPRNRVFTDVEVGLNHSLRDKKHEVREYLMQVAAGAHAGADIPGGVAAMAGDSELQMLTFDASGSIAGVNFVPKEHPAIWNKDWKVTEKVSTLYSKLDIDTEAAGIPVTGNLGLQLVHTQQESTAYSVNKDGGTSDADRPVAPFTDGTGYNDVLPSLNLAGDLGHQQTLRFALAKVMARPTMGDMRASNGFGLDTTRGIYTGGGGNPHLKPFRADAADLSYEKYFGNKGYVSAAVFYKKLNTYIVNLTNDHYDYTPLIQPTTVKASTNIGEYTTPTNGNGGSIKGYELAASLPLNMVASFLDGFGIEANFANTSSALKLPDITDGASGGSMPLPGLSRKTGALAVYFEKAGFSARVSESYRSDFVGDVIGEGGDRYSTYIKGAKYLSAQIGYEIQSGPAKGLSFIVQGNNLSNTPFVRYRQTPDNEIEHTKYGSTILFGLNYKM